MQKHIRIIFVSLWSMTAWISYMARSCSVLLTSVWGTLNSHGRKFWAKDLNQYTFWQFSVDLACDGLVLCVSHISLGDATGTSGSYLGGSRCVSGWHYCAKNRFSKTSSERYTRYSSASALTIWNSTLGSANFQILSWIFRQISQRKWNHNVPRWTWSR